MRRLATAVLVLAAGVSRGADATPLAPPSRTFELTYETRVTGLAPDQSARVWVPVPPTNADQDVTVVKRDLPAPATEGRDAAYGNRILYVESKPGPDGTVALTVAYKVTRRERAACDSGDADLVARALKADARVPVGGACVKLLEGKVVPQDPLAAARVLYDTVFGHMKYDKTGTGWGRGDAEWACESGRGNCSDFHSLFIALARSRKIPAVFEIGFALPAKRGSGEIAGYHCWALFRTEKAGWVPVDISEASKDPTKRDYYFGHLTPDRVLFSVGRDIALEPKPAGGPLNFFVYPYAEAGGEPVPPERIKTTVRFRDVE